METYLLSFKIQGIKNIEKPIYIECYKKNILEEFNFKNYNIKSIFGANGAGKTTIIEALSILQGIALNPNYLMEKRTVLNQLVHPKLQYIYLEARFVATHFFGREKANIKHSLKIAPDSLGNWELIDEQLYIDSLTFFKVNNGVLSQRITKINKNESKYFLNASQHSSMISLLFTYVQLGEEKGYYFREKIIHFVAMVVHAYSNIYLFFENRHKTKLATLDLQHCHDWLDQFLNRKTEQLFFQLTKPKTFPKDDKNAVEQYQEKANKLLAFLKLGNKNIQNIRLNTLNTKETLHISLSIEYAGYTVDLKDESKGIKKMVEIFEILTCLQQGKIVVADDFDLRADIVFLTSFLEYIGANVLGQLIFTTYNIFTLDILKAQKKAIDFLTEDGTISRWTKNGNYSILSTYRKGLIEGLPLRTINGEFLGDFEDKGNKQNK